MIERDSFLKLLCAKSRDDAATVHLFSKPSFGEKKPLDKDDNREIAVEITSRYSAILSNSLAHEYCNPKTFGKKCHLIWMVGRVPFSPKEGKPERQRTRLLH